MMKDRSNVDSRNIFLLGAGLVPLSYSERALEVYPSAELEVIPGAGHGFHNSAAQRAIDRMSEYFSQHLTGYRLLCQKAPGKFARFAVNVRVFPAR